MPRYDPYSRFARRHLSTPVARALYLMLLGGRTGRSWTAEAAARYTRFPLADVETTLAAFEAAGIAQHVAHKSRPARYRWRQNVDYLDDEVDSDEFVDPVCGMPVVVDSPYCQPDRAGRQVRFCSAECQDAFRARPTGYPHRDRDAPTWPVP